MAGDLITFAATVGDELTVEAEFHIDGIEIIEAFESKKKRPMPETLEVLGSGRDQPLVTTHLVKGRKGRDRDRDSGDRRGRQDRRSRGDRGDRGDRDRQDSRREDDRLKAKRLRPARTHRQAVIDSLPEEQKPVAEKMVRDGISSVEQALRDQRKKARDTAQAKKDAAQKAAKAEKQAAEDTVKAGPIAEKETAKAETATTATTETATTEPTAAEEMPEATAAETVPEAPDDEATPTEATTDDPEAPDDEATPTEATTDDPEAPDDEATAAEATPKAPDDEAKPEKTPKAETKPARRAAKEKKPDSKPADDFLTEAGKLLSRMRSAEWRDRVEAALAGIDDVDLRDLRSVVGAAEAGATDDEAKALAEELRTKLTERVDREHAEWLAEVAATLADGRMVRALRLSSRPPKAGVPLPQDMVTRLTEAANAALTSDTPSKRWTTVLGAVAFSPVRRTVQPQGVPENPDKELLAEVKKLSERVPHIAAMFGVEPTPPPRRGRRGAGAPTASRR